MKRCLHAKVCADSNQWTRFILEKSCATGVEKRLHASPRESGEQEQWDLCICPVAEIR